MSFAIRPARIDDADRIAHVHWKSWQETYPGLMPPEIMARVTLEFRTKQWRQMIQTLDEDQFRAVAESGSGEIVGAAQCGPAREAELDAAHEIRMLYVLREAQGFGVGRALVAAMFDFLRARDGAQPIQQPESGALVPPTKPVGLWVLKGNPTISFYERMGARRTGVVKEDSTRGATIWDVAMRWDGAP